MDYYSAIIKNEILLFATTWMDLDAKWNGSDRERQMPYDFTYMWNLKKERSEQT